MALWACGFHPQGCGRPHRGWDAGGSWVMCDLSRSVSNHPSGCHVENGQDEETGAGEHVKGPSQWDYGSLDMRGRMKRSG